MGQKGVIPKRSEERIRRNKPDIEITKIPMQGSVDQPALDIVNPHPIVTDLWWAMGESGQSKWYEPSDWQYARFILHFANDLLHQSRPNANLLQTVNSALGELLVSEGARRRVRMEIERENAKAQVIDIAKEFERRLGRASAS